MYKFGFCFNSGENTHHFLTVFRINVESISQGKKAIKWTRKLIISITLNSFSSVKHVGFRCPADNQAAEVGLRIKWTEDEIAASQSGL